MAIPPAVNMTVVADSAAQVRYANDGIACGEAGIHLFMALYGLSVFLETPKELRSRRTRYIVLSFVITALKIFQVSLDKAWGFRVLFEAGSPDGWIEMHGKYREWWVRFASMGTYTAITVIGDGLLVYRCYVVWSHCPWVLIPPILTYLASTAVGIATVAIPESTGNPNLNLEGAWAFLVVCTNLMVTGLISFHLIQARRRLSKMLHASDDEFGARSSSSHPRLECYTGVVAILIEAVLPLTIFGIVNAALVVTGPAKDTTGAYVGYDVAINVFDYLFIAFSALSPHMIIFRVTTGRSWAARPPSVDSDGDVLSRPIAFARGPSAAVVTQSSRTSEDHIGRGDLKVETEKSL
ncbi:hypothetical protein MD484_g5194, partial [Candolleomyces efflorescens]